MSSYDEDESDDEDWYDDEDESGDDEAAPCPECGAVVHSFTDKCPACGYWLSADDRRAPRRGERTPRWLVVTAWVVLAAFLMPIIMAMLTVLGRRASQ